MKKEEYEQASDPLKIFLMEEKLNSIQWDRVANDKNSGINSPFIRAPLAHAMFKLLLKDIADNELEWHDYLRNCLEENISKV
jgi:hypothetical protein